MAFSSSGGLGGSGGGGGGEMDPELQRFVQMETQKARFQANVHQFLDLCWDKCVDKVSASKTDQCIATCVERFMETSNHVIQELSKNQHQ